MDTLKEQLFIISQFMFNSPLGFLFMFLVALLMLCVVYFYINRPKCICRRPDPRALLLGGFVCDQCKRKIKL